MLECLVFGRRAALAALDEQRVPGLSQAPARSWSGRGNGSDPRTCLDEPVTPELRLAFWRDCGLIRDAAGLERLRTASHLLARLIAESALTREESRGSHFRADFPVESESFARHVVRRPGSEPVLETWR
jgi:L-aspartate oxidase